MSREEGKIREELSAYLDGELTEADARRVEAAVGADPDLAAELKSLRAVSGMVRRLPRRRAPAGLAERVLAQSERGQLLAGTGEAGAKGVSWPARLAVAAGVLVAVGIGLALVALRPGDLQPTGTPLARHEPARPVRGPDADRPAKKASIVPLNFVINTDNLAQAQRDVERVFDSNLLQRVAVEKEEYGEVDGADGILGLANFYAQTGQAAGTVRYEVVMSEDRLRQIVDDLNGIRGRQNVAQIPVTGEFAEPTVELAMGDARVRPKAGAASVGREVERVPAASPGPPAPVAPSPERAKNELMVGKRFRAKAPDEGDAFAPKGRRVREGTGAAAPTTRPAEQVEVAAEVYNGAMKTKAESGPGGEGGLLGDLWRRALRAAGGERLQRGEPSAAGSDLARVQRKLLPESAPTLPVDGKLTKGLEAGRYSYVLPAARLGQAATQAGVNVRQLVVILNEVDVSGQRE